MDGVPNAVVAEEDALKNDAATGDTLAADDSLEAEKLLGGRLKEEASVHGRAPVDGIPEEESDGILAGEGRLI